jgi:hypothetical protein
LPVLPAAELPPDVKRDSVLEQVAEHAQSPQEAHRVGCEYETSADLLQLWGLLVDDSRQASALQEGSGCQAADAAADDGNTQAATRRRSA